MPNYPQNSPLITDKEKQPTKNGTGFVNLQKYLGANEGNQLGGAVAGNIQQAGQQAQQGLATQQNQFNQNLQQARSGITQNQQNIQGVLGRFDQPDNFQGVTDQEAEKFKNLQTQQYGGPVGFENAPQLQQQAARAASLGQLAQSREGRQELLRGSVKAPQYTNSQQRLDEILLSQGGGAGQVRQAGQQIKQQTPEVERQIAVAQSQGQKAKKDFQDLQQQAATGVQTKEKSLQDLLQGRFGDYSKAQQDLLNTARQQIASGTVDRDIANKIGLNLPGDESRFIQGFDPTAYLRESAAPTISAITSQDEAARLNALAKLTTQNNSFLIPKSDEIGTYDPNKAVSYRNEDLAQQVANNQRRYQQQLDRTAVIAQPFGFLGGANGYDPLSVSFVEPDQNTYSYLSGIDQSLAGLDAAQGMYGKSPYYQNFIDKIAAKKAQIQQQQGYNNTLKIK